MKHLSFRFIMSGLIKLYVGSLPFNIRDADLKCMFSKYGTPCNGNLIMILNFIKSKINKCQKLII